MKTIGPYICMRGKSGPEGDIAAGVTEPAGLRTLKVSNKKKRRKKRNTKNEEGDSWTDRETVREDGPQGETGRRNL